jgi:hypothetical protein
MADGPPGLAFCPLQFHVYSQLLLHTLEGAPALVCVSELSS